MYVGHPHLHSVNLLVMLNLGKIHVSPQYHVVLDNGLFTVESKSTKTKEQMDTLFINLFKSKRWNFSENYEDNVTNRHHVDSTWNVIDNPNKVVESEKL